MKTLIWAHADCLSRRSSPFRRFPEAASVYVLDPDQVGVDEWAWQRAAFLYESALDLGCQVRKGDTTAELLWAARAEGCDTIVTCPSADPTFDQVCAELRKSVKLEILPAPADTDIDLRSFDGYWKRADFMAAA